MDLHPGERIVFEGHPSWRALLSFYLSAIAVAIAVAVRGPPSTAAQDRTTV